MAKYCTRGQKNFAARIKMAIFATPKDIHEARTESRPPSAGNRPLSLGFKPKAVESRLNPYYATLGTGTDCRPANAKHGKEKRVPATAGANPSPFITKNDSALVRTQRIL
jgi:hypothetical protein